MTRVQKLKQMLNQNIAARLFIYAAALVEPVVTLGTFTKFDFPINPYYVLWISFYACVLLIWACNEKTFEQIVNVLLVGLNVSILAIWCFASLMGGLSGLLITFVVLITPFPLLILLRNMGGFQAVFACCVVAVVIIAVIFWKNTKTDDT